jgi:hypothetical protein
MELTKAARQELFMSSFEKAMRVLLGTGRFSDSDAARADGIPIAGNAPATPRAAAP